MKERLYWNALVLIVMIVTLPISATRIYAQSYGLDIEFAYGVDKFYYQDLATRLIIGYARSDDVITAKLVAQIDDDSEISNSQVQVKRMSVYEDTVCTGNSCTYERNFYSSSGVSSYTARLRDDEGKTLLTKNFKIVSDSEGPVFNSFTASPEVSVSGRITISYNVKDQSYSEYCLGVKDVIVKESTSDTTVSTKSYPTNKYSCDELSETIEWTAPSDGEYRFCSVASDYFGHNTSSSCKYVTVDTTPPTVTTLNISYYNDARIEVLGNFSTTVYAKVYFTQDSSDLDETTVKANFYPFTSNEWKRADTCYRGTHSTYCLWSLSVRINESITPKCDVEFSDIYGNNDTATLTNSYSIDYDGTPPEVTSISTNNGILSNNNQLIKNRNNVTIQLTETYFKEKKAYLKSSSLGISNLEPDNCTESSPYTCRYDNLIVNVDDGDYELCAYAVDDLENIGSDFCINVTADTKGPELHSIQVIPQYMDEYGLRELIGNRTMKGDYFEIVATLKDMGSSISSDGNFSSIILNQTALVGSQGSCTSLENNYFNCTWITPAIDTDDIGVLPLHFTFYDEIDNPTYASIDVYVYGSENKTGYWDAEVSCSPRNFDKKMFALANLPSYCRINLVPKEENINTLDIEFIDSECEPTHSERDYIYSWSIMNDFAGSLNPYLVARFQAVDSVEDSLGYKCILYILSEKIESGGSINGSMHYTFQGCTGSCSSRNMPISTSEKRYIVTEYEPVNITMAWSFEGDPLGTIDESYKDMIRDVVDDSWVAAEWIGQLSKFVSIADSLCQILDIITNVQTILETWETISIGVAKVYAPFTPVKEASKAATDAGSFSLTNIEEIFSKFCSMVACQSPDGSPWSFILDDKTKGEDGLTEYGRFVKKFNFDFTIGDKYAKGDKNIPEGKEAGDPTGETAHFTIGTWGDIRSNCILSIATLCIPGIIDCMQRWRQIQCKYGSCLITTVKSYMDPVICSGMKENDECKFIFGEIFGAMPFVSWIRQFYKKIVNILKNPLGLLFAGVEMLCNQFFAVDEFHLGCHIYKLTREVTVLFSQLKAIFEGADSMFSGGTDLCETFLADAATLLDGDGEDSETETETSASSTESEE